VKETAYSKWPLFIGVATLMAVGAGLIYHKVTAYGYSLRPKESQPVWLVEAAISFRAEGGPIKVSLSVPRDSSACRILEEQSIAPGYSLSLQDRSPGRRAVWSRREARGRQYLYYRLEAYDVFGGQVRIPQRPPPAAPDPPVLEEPFRSAAAALANRIHGRSADAESFAAETLRQVYAKPPAEEVGILLGRADNRVDLARLLLSMEGVPSRVARGVSLERDTKREPMRELIDVYTGEAWELFDPATGQKGLPPRFLLWQRGEVSLLDVIGGRGSQVTVSVIRKARPTQELVAERLRDSESSGLWDLSVYSLPISDQNTFKRLFVIPVGALIVVLVRNFVGFKTSGTFMPILIALAFLETRLLPGLLILLLMIVVGLSIRSYLSHLNLLLVPRIAVTVIVVVFIMASISILSFKLGVQSGLSVTFFPIIIIAWTIERMSIAAEEQGVREVVSQLAGTLVVAILVYLVMGNETVAHFMYAFPEANLVVLGFIALMGVYTGYRLTELRRFEPLARPRSPEP